MSADEERIYVRQRGTWDWRRHRRKTSGEVSFPAIPRGDRFQVPDQEGGWHTDKTIGSAKAVVCQSEVLVTLRILTESPLFRGRRGALGSIQNAASREARPACGGRRGAQAARRSSHARARESGGHAATARPPGARLTSSARYARAALIRGTGREARFRRGFPGGRDASTIENSRDMSDNCNGSSVPCD